MLEVNVDYANQGDGIELYHEKSLESYPSNYSVKLKVQNLFQTMPN